MTTRTSSVGNLHLIDDIEEDTPDNFPTIAYLFHRLSRFQDEVRMRHNGIKPNEYFLSGTNMRYGDLCRETAKLARDYADAIEAQAGMTHG